MFESNSLGTPDLIGEELPKCPERSEEYREIEQKSMGKPNLRNERHSVSTSTKVVVRNGEVALEISASCKCGWRSSKTVGFNE